ncbi:ketol-acid reductoisomerase [Buchnera aphidicola (Mindarus keteleerifoliae)]|uniref:ketol-acid reductoisomerase n=1 Tax=Buchnera aphidicola TaxID=9 RepID=UPI0031B6C60F
MNYFNDLNFREKVIELKTCRFMKKKEFLEGIKYLKNKKIVIVGCGSQGLNQGLNMRDSGLNVAYALRKKSLNKKNESFKRANENNFEVNDYKTLIPHADLVINLTPDKQHSSVVKELQPLMKKGSTLGYSHGFNIVEMGEIIRDDITVIMVAPKSPGTEVREEFKKNFGVPTLIAVHKKNDIEKKGLDIAKAWAVGIGGHRAGVLYSSFSAEVKSDLMGEQTILCGLLQTGSLVCFKTLIKNGYNKEYASKFIQHGWETITAALKIGGITLMLNKLSNFQKARVLKISDQLKKLLTPLFREHMDNIISGFFSKKMMEDWKNKDLILFSEREKTKKSSFEKLGSYKNDIEEMEFFNKGLFMIAIIKAGVELAFEIMTETGILEESAYYESLHELPLIANTIARKKLYEMNVVISDTAEYGNYIFSKKALPILKKYSEKLKKTDLGFELKEKVVENKVLQILNEKIENHPIEIIGRKLRKYMKEMRFF